MLFTDKPVDCEVVGDQLLIELFSAELLLALVLEITNDNHHQKEDAEKIQEYTFVKVHNLKEFTILSFTIYYLKTGVDRFVI